jgi:glutamyl-tRNA reductase
MIRQIWGVHEFFILNTCNRIEIVAAVSQEASTCGILRRLLRLDQLRPDLYYMKHGFDAFAHLCLVTAGMDSQTPGESHVVSQMKEAVDEAVTFGWAGSIIRELADAALHVSKDIHQEIDPLMDIAEIEEVALRYLDHTLPGLPQRRVLVIGSGTVGQGLVSGLLALGCACDWAYFRTAPELSEEGARRVRVVQLDRLNEVLPEVDAIISAVDAREPVITVAAHAAQLRTDGVVMVDLGMPRNIDPAFDRCGGPIRLADLDALKHWYRSATGTLDKILESCRAILAEHRDIYERMRRSIQGGKANGQ